MKLSNFEYSISARAEGTIFHVVASHAFKGTHAFLAHRIGINNLWVITSPEISDMCESGELIEAEALRTMLHSLFIANHAAIAAATKKTTEYVDIQML